MSVTQPGTGDRTRLLAVARGDAEPDLVVEGANVFCAFTREWLDGDVAVADGAGVVSSRGESSRPPRPRCASSGCRSAA